MKDQVQWMTPSPLWLEPARSADAKVRRMLARPALLRFASDTFMEEFAALLESQPARLTEYIALPETWRAPAPMPQPIVQAPEFVRKLSSLQLAANRKLNHLSGHTPAKLISRRAADALAATSNAVSVAVAAVEQKPLKLYQPAHQRFYLVTACLVCRLPGLPDHALQSARAERVSSVLRRLYQQPSAPRQPANPIEEYAFIATPQGNGWQKVGSADKLLKNEEQLPLFGVNFIESDGRRRRLFCGMIPVGKREEYMGAGTFTPATNGNSAPNSTAKTARKIHFRTQVTEPWKNLLRSAGDDAKTLSTIALAEPPSSRPEQERSLKKESRQSVQTLSWYILLDFVKYLQLYLPRFWPAVLAQSKAGRGLNRQEENLYDALDGIRFTGPQITSLRDGTSYTTAQFASSMLNALSRMGQPDRADPSKLFWEDKLDKVTAPYNREASSIDANWPDFIYPLADLDEVVPLPPSSIGAPPPGEEADEGDGLSSAGVPVGLATSQARVDKLAALVVRALPTESNTAVPPSPLAAQPVLDTQEGTFLIRCVYERPVCGPLDPPLLSEPSALFQMAGFFDSDAPARPIRIALPLDTSPAGLRKFDKNTAFMISDQLCGQMQRLKGITFADLVLSVLPWPFHKSLSVGAPEIGPCRSAGLELGMICTLSIPIITICALILLFIIVLLLDIIFKWIPFFIMCFPLPGFKGKKS
jgi:hypothetical protein